MKQSARTSPEQLHHSAAPRHASAVNTQRAFTDNRTSAIAQSKQIEMIARSRRALTQREQMAAITGKATQRMGQGHTDGVAQLLKVDDDHIRADLRHEKGHKLFTPETIEDIETRAGASISRVSNLVLDAAVNASRTAGEMDYKVLSQQAVTSEKQLTAFMDKNEDDEHMYVLQDDTLHVAIRAEDKKLPHPTLVGGDPDVKCAGTMRKTTEGAIVVTASSGHFRPPSPVPGQRAVNKMMEKTATKTHKKKVGKSAR